MLVLISITGFSAVLERTSRKHNSISYAFRRAAVRLCHCGKPSLLSNLGKTLACLRRATRGTTMQLLFNP